MQEARFKSLNHAKFKIRYHLIFSTKYRRRLLDPMTEDLKTSMRRAESLSLGKWQIDLMEIDSSKPDHIHLLVEARPQVAPEEIVKLLKQISTYDMWHSRWRDWLLKFYWKEHHLWTRGYFCASIGDISTKTIQQYIQKQG